MFLSSLTMIALFLNEGGPNLTEGFLENPKGSLGKPNKPEVSRIPLLFTSW